MATYSRSIKQRLSLIFCVGLTLVGLASVTLVGVVVLLSVTGWMSAAQAEVERLRQGTITGHQQAVGVLIGNLIQNALTDLHIVSNAEYLVNQG